MTSIRIYSGGSALIILIVFILSQYLLSLDSPIAIHNPPTSCISVGDGKKSICAVCLNNTKILTLPGYGWKIESDQNFRIGKFKQKSYIQCSEFLQMIDSAKIQVDDGITLQNIQSIQAIGQEAGFTSNVGSINSTSIPINFAELILVNINNQNQISKFQISTPNPVINSALIFWVQLLSYVGSALTAIIVVLYRNQKGWVTPILSLLPSVTLLLLLNILDFVTYQSRLLIIPLTCYYLYLAYILNLPNISIFVLCSLLLLNDIKLIGILTQTTFLCVIILYNWNNTNTSNIFCLSSTVLLIINSFYLRVKWNDAISVRCSLFQASLVIFVPILMELQRLQISKIQNPKEVKISAVESEQSSLHIQE